MKRLFIIALPVIILPLTLRAQILPPVPFLEMPGVASAVSQFNETIADAALGYSAWSLANNRNSFQRVGGYRVKGTPYLFDAAYQGNVYTPSSGTGINVLIGYDTYRQQLQVYMQPNDKTTIVKECNEVDSFTLKANDKTFFKEDLLFVNARLYDSSKKFFVMNVFEGKRFTLFKTYKSELGMTENYIQSDVRQFNLTFEFYYLDKEKKGLHLLKCSAKALKNEFKDMVNVASIVTQEGLNRDPETELTTLFQAIDK